MNRRWLLRGVGWVCFSQSFLGGVAKASDMFHIPSRGRWMPWTGRRPIMARVHLLVCALIGDMIRKGKIMSRGVEG